MDFAKKLMEKYGWKEGDGLGKNNDGINKALKANLKFDKAGLGVDQAADFNNHWWERVFNEAANNIDVQTNGDEISMKVKDENSVEITTKEYSIKKLKKAKDNNSQSTYNNFLKTARLTNLGNEESDPNQIHVKDIQITKFKQLTDEELFAACGGRTAHKGARHGLLLNGKLSRIDEQEKLLLAKIQNNNLVKEETDNEWTLVKQHKKKKKCKNENTIENNSEDSKKLLNEIIYNSEYHIKSKKKKKKQKEIDNNLSTSFDLISIEKPNENMEILGLNEKSKTIKRDKKKKKSKNISNSEENKSKTEEIWSNYRNPESLKELEQIEDEIISQQDDKEISHSSKIKKKEKSNNLHVTLESSKKIKKKKKNDNKKYSKILKKTVENITENLDNCEV